MGDVSIIARRHEDGHVEYGWSGNGGYFKMVGVRLLIWECYREIYDYFDDWVLIKANEFNSQITDIIAKRKLGKHIETCEW